MASHDERESELWNLDEQPSGWLLMVGAELETASVFLRRAELSPWHICAAAAIVASTIIDVRNVAQSLEPHLAPVFDDVADDLERAQGVIRSDTRDDKDLVAALLAIEAVSQLLYWAATDLQIRSLPEA